tara:strand:+ start:240 stop:668 length:429 start_codon:yes stop_codon:yes gene_type:complete
MARKKIVASTENNGWVAPKVRKKRKPMTEEQRIAASERLEKARAAKSPAKNDSVCSYVIDKGDDHPLSASKVKQWIKTQKSLSSSYKLEVRKDIKGSHSKYSNCVAYVRNMQHYLKHGDWCDDFYGEYAEKRIKWKTIHPAG